MTAPLKRFWEKLFPGSTDSREAQEREEEQQDISLGERLARLNDAQADAFRHAAKQHQDSRLERLAEHAETEAQLYRLHGLEAEAFDVLVEEDE